MSTVNIIIAIAIGIGVCILLMFLMGRLFNRLYMKSRGIHFKFFKSVVNVLLTLLCIYYCLSFFEFTKEMGRILLQSGTLLIAILTFAAQQALGNVISGFSISMTKPYKAGDKVKVIDGSNILAEGIIDDVTIRHTVIRTFDGQSAIIPNSTMDSSVIVNTNFTENVGNFVEVEVGFDADIDKACELFRKIVMEHELTLNDESTKVMLNRYEPSGVVLKTTVWTENLDSSFRACSDIRKGILKEFAKNNIEIPYKTVTVKKEKANAKK